jgi:RNA recognition motif-containing protein
MKKLFVHLAGADYNQSKEDRIAMVKDLFNSVTVLEESQIQVIIDKNYGDLKNFVFVSIEDDAVANQAIESLNETEIDGIKVSVNEAKPMEKRDGGSRGGSRGGYNSNNGGGSRGGYSSNRSY